MCRPCADRVLAMHGVVVRYPNATVLSSTFDAFFDEANKPANKAKLPVVTAEIGDGWLYVALPPNIHNIASR